MSNQGSQGHMGESSDDAHGGAGQTLAEVMERRDLTTFDVAETAAVDVTDVRHYLAGDHVAVDERALQRLRAWVDAERG